MDAVSLGSLTSLIIKHLARVLSLYAQPHIHQHFGTTHNTFFGKALAEIVGVVSLSTATSLMNV